jgi:hypothetical protein
MVGVVAAVAVVAVVVHAVVVRIVPVVVGRQNTSVAYGTIGVMGVLGLVAAAGRVVVGIALLLHHHCIFFVFLLNL